MNKTPIITLLLIALLALGAMTALAQDETEIPVLASGDSVEGILTNENSAVLYGFNATEDDTVSLSMTPIEDSTATPYLVVLGAAGQLIAADIEREDESADLEFDAPYTGSYFVLATTFAAVQDDAFEGFENEDGEGFTLNIEGNTLPEGAEDALTYFRNPVQYNSTLQGYTSASEPVYYFVFEGLRDDQLDLILSSPSIDPLLFLFDSDGNRIAFNNNTLRDDLTSEFDSSLDGLLIPGDGVYLIFATDNNFFEVNENYRGGNFIIGVEQANSDD